MIHKHILDAIYLANSRPPLLLDDYNRIEETISKEFRWYLIGLTCSFANEKKFESEELNYELTRKQIAQNSGYSKDTMTRLVCYAKAVTRLYNILPESASDILSGKIKLGLKSAIIIMKLSPDDITVIMKRIESENAPVRRIISEQVKNPLAHSQIFSERQNAKSYPKSIKDTPRYDPDAQITGLIYTIPSWVKAIDRINIYGNLCDVSKSARNNLNNELANLKIVVEALIELMMEANND